MRRTYITVAIVFTIASIPVPGMIVFAIVFWWHASLLNRQHRVDQRIATQRANRLAHEEQRRREDQLIRAARAFR